jgi:hypothetical protein
MRGRACGCEHPSAYLLQGEDVGARRGYVNPRRRQTQRAARITSHSRPVAIVVHPPGYPAFVGAVVWVVWHTPIPDRAVVRTVGLIQAVLGTISVLLAYAIARAAFGTRTALLAAALVAFYPNLIATTATLQLETVFVFLTLLTAFVLLPVAVGDHPSVARLVGGGLLTGVVALVRPTIGLVIVALLITLLIARAGRRSCDVALVVLLMVVARSLDRAQRVRLRVVLVSTGIGPTLCLAEPEATGKLDTDHVPQVQPHRHPRRRLLDVATNSQTHQRSNG